MNSSQPYRASPKIGLKNKSQYEVYEDDLNNYKNRSREKLLLDQWNLIQSRLMSPTNNANNKNSSKSQNKHNGKRLQSDKNNNEYSHPDQKADKRILGVASYQNNQNGELKQPKSSRVSSVRDKNQAGSYTQKIKMQFEATDCEDKKVEQIQKQIKSMRQMLLQLNNLVTMKLSKYQMAQFAPKGMAVSNQPEKEQEILLAKIQLNSRIIQGLQKQIKQIQQRDKELEEHDYLVQLEQSSNQILKNIRQKRKLKHKEGVAVQKLDGRLIELRDAAEDDQYKMVKVIKHNSLYYFKKFNENKALLSELDKNFKQLQEKDSKITQKLNHFAKIAEQKNLLVKANRSYIEIKKINDEMIVKHEQAKKRVEVVKRAKQTECQKITKQIQKMKAQMVSTQAKLQQFQIRGQQVHNFTESMLQKNQIAPRLLNKLSQKFNDSILRQHAHTLTPKQSSQLDIQSNQNNATKDLTLPYIKPKLSLSKKNSPKHSDRYQTLSVERQPKVNDKNQTINFEQAKSKEYRIKPNINIKKKGDNQHSLLKSEEIVNGVDQHKSEQVSFSRRVMGILSKRKADDKAQ